MCHILDKFLIHSSSKKENDQIAFMCKMYSAIKTLSIFIS